MLIYLLIKLFLLTLFASSVQSILDEVPTLYTGTYYSISTSSPSSVPTDTAIMKPMEATTSILTGENPSPQSTRPPWDSTTSK